MKYVDEFRSPQAMTRLRDALTEVTTRPWSVMEICGGQTHTIARYGLRDLLPESLTLIHGPGCPVCVTPLEILEKARRIAMRPDAVVHTFADMLRVPGMHGDLLDARARGGDVRTLLSPVEAVLAARAEPERTHVLFAIGFETTAPTTAGAILLAERLGVPNFVVLSSHVRVPPAIEALLSDPETKIDGFLAAGHVCTVEGFEDEYPELAERHGVPIVVTGFEPVDIMKGMLRCIELLERGDALVDNAYPRAVVAQGNKAARDAVGRVFAIADRPWRGFGVLPRGGLTIRNELAHRDAEQRFPMRVTGAEEPAACRAERVLRGLMSPLECPELGRGCTPEHPLGAPMVSSEGACAAYHRFIPLGKRA